MKALLLCAGRGERLRPLTDRRPKPLIDLGGHALVEHHLYALSRAGFDQVVINLAYKGRMIERTLGSGSRYGIDIEYSREGRVPLNSGGAITHAAALLGDEPFLVVNGDIYCNFPFATLKEKDVDTAHLVLVPNPGHNPDGDFGLRDNVVANEGDDKLTYAGIAVYRRALVDDATDRRFSVVPYLRDAADRGVVTGERFDGTWIDVGTPDRLAQARALVASL